MPLQQLEQKSNRDIKGETDRVTKLVLVLSHL